jgi:predicted ArsR family transcriptional regulator
MSSRYPSENEQAVLDLIRYQGPASVAQLCDYLQVTATAVRQRLSTLVAAGLLERVVVRQERGRPVHQYQLTREGMAAMGDNLADLAEALWLEVIHIADPQTRQSVIQGVLGRLTEKYRDQIAGRTLTERLQSIAELFRRRRIPFVVEADDRQATLRIAGCPYPQLSDHSEEICQLEQQLVVRLLNEPLALSHCTCDATGGQCCTFSSEVARQLSEPPVPRLSSPNPGSTPREASPPREESEHSATASA